MYWVGVEHEGVQRDDRRNEAVLFHCQDREVWIPRSQLKDYDDDHMIIPLWLAEKRELEPDWEL